MKKGFTLFDMLIVLVIIGILAALLLPALSNVQEKAKQAKCKANLSMMGKIQRVYMLDFGRSVLYPQANGAGFFTTLYHEGLLAEPIVYICPSTPDYNSEGYDLQHVKDEDSKDNFVSYAGRKNKDQRIYPGIFKPYADTTTTPMGSDDIDQPYGDTNHPDIYIFLFVDAHVDHIRYRGDWQQELHEILDPLTN